MWPCVGAHGRRAVDELPAGAVQDEGAAGEAVHDHLVRHHAAGRHHGRLRRHNSNGSSGERVGGQHLDTTDGYAGTTATVVGAGV